MSFTAGGIYIRESVEIASLYLEILDWDLVRRKAVEHNLIQARTISSSARICREICFRLGRLSIDELMILTEGTIQEQRQILWLAICRHYRFIYEFAVEVVREKYLSLNFDLYKEDYDAFFNAKAECHEELERLTEKTRLKLRQVVFRMLREADLLTKGNRINPAMLIPRVAQTLRKASPADLSVFPASDAEIKEMLK
ncbi:MAG: hypothetical protein A4E70_01070 [Syntrophus sp. PtaU1.Bin005]|nr:MAG: hypothetical protein A4E70_01070 [Syntrophus sp. PtaU1.Bin005]